LASAIIYTLLLGVILACNHARVAAAVRALLSGAQPEKMPFRQRAKVALAAIIGMGFLFALDQMLVNLLGHGKG
jgi:hypothetical protein